MSPATSRSDARLRLPPVFPGQGTVVDLSGMPLDASGPIWRLNEPTRLRILNWNLLGLESEHLLAVSAAYVAEQVKGYSPTEVCNNFAALGLLKRSEAFKEAERTGGVLSARFLREVTDALGSEAYRAHHLRKWYEWCCDQGYEQFSAEEAFRLREYTIGGNAKGVAVMSADPAEGPLLDVEVVALLNALRAGGAKGTLTMQEQAAVWLCVALGCNPMQFVLLREGDLERFATEDADGAMYTLRVPRMKKGHARVRSEFKARKLTAEIGGLLEGLRSENDALRRRVGTGDATLALPLFSRSKPRKSMLGTPMHEFALGLTAGEFSLLVSNAVAKLAVVSPRTGLPLNVTTRRFRYTFATRLVREGASQRVVAETLDHSDLQNVQCYFDLKSDIVESLDKATALTLGPLSQAFLGHLVRSEADAVRGERPSSRVYRGTSDSGKLEAVGTCGSFSFCNLFAPLACYTCAKFQPWVDGPHETMLQGLLDERRRRTERGLDAKMVALHDVTILAVADVVTRVRSLILAEAEHVG